MRQSKIKTLGEVLKLYVQAFKMEEKLSEAQIVKVWNDMVGQQLKAYIREVKVYNKVLFVYINSSVMRNELNFRKMDYLKMISDKVGKENINDIIFK
jgi:predicted nucleic acid-binding Zn ribbon protein